MKCYITFVSVRYLKEWTESNSISLRPKNCPWQKSILDSDSLCYLSTFPFRSFVLFCLLQWNSFYTVLVRSSVLYCSCVHINHNDMRNRKQRGNDDTLLSQWVCVAISTRTVIYFLVSVRYPRMGGVKFHFFAATERSMTKKTIYVFGFLYFTIYEYTVVPYVRCAIPFFQMKIQQNIYFTQILTPLMLGITSL